MPRLPRRRRSLRERTAGITSRLAQLRQAYQLTRRTDTKLVPIVAGVAVGVFVVLLVVGFLLGHPILLGVFGLLFGVLAGLSVFGRRAQAAAYAQVEGQPGAALAVVQSMRGLWRVTPVVAATRQQDVVHRVIGRPGIVLVAEGAPSRVGPLLGQEKRRLGRVAADTPVYDVVVGAGPGQVPLRRLQNHLMKLPRNLRPADVRAVEGRLRALGTVAPPVPKGPMPRGSVRAPRGGRVR